MNDLLKIESINHLYNLIDDDLIQKYNNISVFRDYMYSYYNGCLCTQKTFNRLSIIEYKKIASNEEAINILKDHFNVSQIEFTDQEIDLT